MIILIRFIRTNILIITLEKYIILTSGVFSYASVFIIRYLHYNNINRMYIYEKT